MKILSQELICVRKGCPVYLQRLADDPYAEWGVQYAGNGHYFPTLSEAEAYMWGRKFYRRSK